jgi:hypothetical protein
MPRFLSTPRRVSGAATAPADSRPRLPGAPGPKPAVISREDTIAELRVIYRLIDSGTLELAKTKLIQLGRNLQS